MRPWKSLTLFLMAPSLLWAAQPNVPGIDVLAAYPAMSSFTVSPDGKHLAALEARGEDRVILVWDTADLQAKPTVIGTQKMKFQTVAFIKDDLLAVSLWQPIDLHAPTRTIRTFTYKFFFTDLQGKNWREPLPQPARSEFDELEQAASSPGLLDPLVNDPTHVLLVVGSGTNQGDIYKVDVTNGRAERIQRAEEHVGDYATDLNGQLRARAQLDTDSRGAFVAIELRNPDTGAWEEHFRTYAKDRDIIGVVGFANDGNTAYLRTNIGRDKAVIQEYDVRARKLGEVVFENKFFDAASIQLHRVKDAQFGEIDSFGYYGPTENDRYFAAPWLQALDKQLTAAFAIKDEPQQVIDIATGKAATAPMRTGRRWNLVSSSLDRRIMVVSVEATNEAPDFFLLRDNKLTLLARTWPAIDPTALGTGKLVYYKARDGLDIPAYLHTPSMALCGTGPWPAVVLPHGGPWARDGLGFDRSMWVPLLTSRCRAVLQPQYRGSADWGRFLWLAGDREWGQKMQDDKDDGARWLIDQKIAIPGRIALYGFSYGGYAAFAAAVRPNGLYKCAIAGAGVSDINKIWARFYTNPYFREHQAPTVKGLNPVDKADEIQIPIYVFHGDRDQTVPIRQSEMFVEKARSGKRNVTYREFKDFDHGPAWLRGTYADVLRGIDDYLTKGCAGGL